MEIVLWLPSNWWTKNITLWYPGSLNHRCSLKEQAILQMHRHTNTNGNQGTPLFKANVTAPFHM